MNGISLPEEQKKPELSFLEARQEAQFSSTSDGLVVERPRQKDSILSEEEQRALMDRAEKLKIEQRKRQIRFENRKSFDELLLKILNGDLFDMFADKQTYFPEIPL